MHHPRQSPLWRAEDFEVKQQIYKGAFSEVFSASVRQSGLPVAVKVYLKDKMSVLNRFQVERERTIHSRLAHDNIIKLHGTFEDEERVYLVQEMADRGDLFIHFKEKPADSLTEKNLVKDILAPFLQGLEYIHSMGIVHRDIKPENILLTSNGIIKIADFGLAIDMKEERPVTRAGTLDYMAPEVLVCANKTSPHENKENEEMAYSVQVDVWAVGILAYELLVGSAPFELGSRIDTYHNILKGEPKFFPWMSEEAKSFISAALCKDALERPTVQQLKMHPWIRLHAGKKEQGGAASPASVRSRSKSDLRAAVAAVVPAPPEHPPSHSGSGSPRITLPRVGTTTASPAAALSGMSPSSPRSPRSPCSSRPFYQAQLSQSSLLRVASAIVLHDSGDTAPGTQLHESLSMPLEKTSSAAAATAPASVSMAQRLAAIRFRRNGAGAVGPSSEERPPSAAIVQMLGPDSAPGSGGTPPSGRRLLMRSCTMSMLADKGPFSASRLSPHPPSLVRGTLERRPSTPEEGVTAGSTQRSLMRSLTQLTPNVSQAERQQATEQSPSSRSSDSPGHSGLLTPLMRSPVGLASGSCSPGPATSSLAERSLGSTSEAGVPRRRTLIRSLTQLRGNQTTQQVSPLSRMMPVSAGSPGLPAGGPRSGPISGRSPGLHHSQSHGQAGAGAGTMLPTREDLLMIAPCEDMYPSSSEASEQVGHLKLESC